MPVQNFWETAARRPDRVAIVDADESVTTSGELLARVNALSNSLQALGLEPGQSVAAMLPNSREALEVYLAIQQIGVYLTPINYHLVGPEIAYIVADCEARAFLVHARYTDVAEAAIAETGFDRDRVVGVGGFRGARAYEDLIASGAPTSPANRRLGQVMNYTSGTTGRPKGVRRPLSMAPLEDTDLAVPLYGYSVTRDEPDNVHLLACPWYHTAPLIMAGPSLHLGHPIVIMDRFDAERALALIQTYRVTITHLVPTQFVRLLALPEAVRHRYDVSSLRHVIHGAAPCAPDVKRRMIAWLGPVLDEYYASTEGVGGTIMFSDEWLRRPGSVGRARNDNVIVILDDDGNVLPAGQIGAVYSQNKTRLDFEYYKDPDKTARSRMGAYRTVGDVGYMDEDGYLYLCDRKADMIISGGVNIYPAEIESVLITHPAVADVAVFGIPHPEWGEEVKAVVELLPDRQTESADAVRDDLLEFLRARVARYKIPKTIDVVASLPRDPNGKLYKRRLRDPYWAGHGRAI